MLQGWKTYKLVDLTNSANTGLDAIKRAPIVEEDTGIKCLRIQDVSQKKEYKNWGFCEVNETNFKKFSLKAEEIIIARTGNSIGVNYYVSKDLVSVFNNGLIRLRFNKDIADPKYIFYIFQSEIFKSYIQAIAYGTSTQPNMQINSLLSFEHIIPPLQEQTQIASILSALDDKIELNLQQNKTLEEMAMAHYKHWFVDFGPFKDGEFVESELGMIPKGWEVVRVDQIADFIDPHPSHRAPKAVEEGYPFAGIGDIDEFGNINRSKARIIGEEAVTQQEASYFINEYSVGFGRVGTVGKVIRLRPQEFRYALSPTMAVVNSRKELYNEITYYMVSSKQFNHQVDNNLTGSTRPTIGIQTLRSLLTCIPKDDVILTDFQNKVKSIYKEVDHLNKENQTLTTLRDALLSKLISGEIRVKDVEQELKKVL